MKFLTGFESAKDREAHSNEHGFACVGDSLTVQADAKDADINVIMDRFARTGQFPPPSRLPSYGDFDGISDYREAIHAVREAEALFMQLPASIRGRFDNDPAQFIDFCEDPKNQLELADLGLLSPEATERVRKAEQEKLEKVKSEAADRTRAPTAAVRDGDVPGSRRRTSGDDSGSA